MLMGPEGSSQLIGCTIVVQFAEDRAPQREAEIARGSFFAAERNVIARARSRAARFDRIESRRAALTHLLLDDELRMSFDL